MKIFNFFKNPKQIIKSNEAPISRKESPQASFNGGEFSSSFVLSYNGEKNLGEIGTIRDYRLDYEGLRLRSWQSYLESEISQTVLNKFAMWVIGSGLKLQTDPVKPVLKSEKLEIDPEAFNEVAEARFKVFSCSKTSDYSGMNNLQIMAKTAFLNSIIGGDVLVVLRYVNNQVKVQLVDGAHLASPFFGTDYYGQAISNGNTVKNGIELSPTGEHIAYYVKTGLLKFERIEATGKKSGKKMAFLVYGMRYRLDNHRGIPLISTVMETLKKLDRYKEATVGSAEERQKITYAIEHDRDSTGESPLAKSISNAFDYGSAEDLPKDVNGKELANTVAATTNKQTFNMPIGAKLTSLESKNELYFKDFYTTNIDLICAAVGIPPEVAMSKYDSNFSASRAALKDWEHTINVNRALFSFQFYQPIFDLWLETEILKNKIQAPGYLKALSEGNDMVLDAYRNSRFVGTSVPHIDPLKEVNAERAKLGQLAAHMPLTTIEAATEVLNGGDSDNNLAQFSEEIKEAERLGINQIIAKPPKEEKPTE